MTTDLRDDCAYMQRSLRRAQRDQAARCVIASVIELALLPRTALRLILSDADEPPRLLLVAVERERPALGERGLAVVASPRPRPPCRGPRRSAGPRTAHGDVHLRRLGCTRRCARSAAPSMLRSAHDEARARGWRRRRRAARRRRPASATARAARRPRRRPPRPRPRRRGARRPRARRARSARRRGSRSSACARASAARSTSISSAVARPRQRGVGRGALDAAPRRARARRPTAR